MKFGHVNTDELDSLDLGLPISHSDNIRILGGQPSKKKNTYVGCAKWGRDEWVGKIYPEGTKSGDFLKNYVNHFNSIELNATFYQARKASLEQWSTIPQGTFKFCPKFSRRISHIKRLKESEENTAWYFDTISALGDTLGLPFLQMPENFAPKYIDRLIDYVNSCPDTPFAVELRHTEWFTDEEVFNSVCEAFEKKNIALVITDTAGRRDCVHQRLTSKSAFVRFIGYDLHPTDNKRMDEWVTQIRDWFEQGLEEIYFFLHQENEANTIYSARYMVEKLNEVLNLNLDTPKFIED